MLSFPWLEKGWLYDLYPSSMSGDDGDPRQASRPRAAPSAIHVGSVALDDIRVSK
jgi:hypothetical protein